MPIIPQGDQDDNQGAVADCGCESIHDTINSVDGSEEIEFTTAYDVFVRAGFETTICGINLEKPPMAKYELATDIHLINSQLLEISENPKRYVDSAF